MIVSDQSGHAHQRILVTGATGFVGAALVDRLKRTEASVRATSRHIGESLGNVDAVVVSGLDSATNWADALVGVTVVIHAAARVHVMNDGAENPLQAFRQINVEGTLNLARQGAAAGVKRFVFISSVKVNGEATFPGQRFTEKDIPAPLDPYGVSKMEAEVGLRMIAHDTGMEIVIIRPPLVYGPGVKANFAALMRVVQRGIPLPLGSVHNQRSLVALDNLVDLILTCLAHPNAANETFLVSDGHDLSTTELVREMAKAVGVPARLLPVPVWLLRGCASLLGKGETVQRLCGNLQVDISKVRALLNWQPPVSVERGLKLASVDLQDSHMKNGVA